jgi:hypothetical protein
MLRDYRLGAPDQVSKLSMSEIAGNENADLSFEGLAKEERKTPSGLLERGCYDGNRRHGVG